MPAKDEDLKVRVPGPLKRAVRSIADSRLTSESAIVREALLEYFERRHPPTFSEQPAPYGSPPPSASTPMPASLVPPPAPVRDQIRRVVRHLEAQAPKPRRKPATRAPK